MRLSVMNIGNPLKHDSKASSDESTGETTADTGSDSSRETGPGQENGLPDSSNENTQNPTYVAGVYKVTELGYVQEGLSGPYDDTLTVTPEAIPYVSITVFNIKEFYKLGDKVVCHKAKIVALSFSLIL